MLLTRCLRPWRTFATCIRRALLTNNCTRLHLEWSLRGDFSGGSVTNSRSASEKNGGGVA